MKELLFYSFTGIVSKTPKKEKAKHEEKINTLFYPKFCSKFCPTIDPFVRKTPKPILSENRPAKKTPIAFFYFFLLFYIELFTEMSENTLLKTFSITYL